MSDLHKLRQKATEGEEWRGTIRVMMGDDEALLTVRQLKDPEFFEVMSMIKQDELESLQGELPDDKMERYNELQDKDELTEDESDEFAALEEELAEVSGNLFNILSRQTFNGILLCAKYAVEPDDEDLRSALMDDEWVMEKEQQGYGPIKTPEDCYEPMKDEIEDTIENLTDFTSFNIGIQALIETVGDAGN